MLSASQKGHLAYLSNTIQFAKGFANPKIHTILGKFKITQQIPNIHPKICILYVIIINVFLDI